MKIEGIEIRKHPTSELLKQRKLFGFFLSYIPILSIGSGIGGVWLLLQAIEDTFWVPMCIMAFLFCVIFGAIGIYFVSLIRGINTELKKREISKWDRAASKRFSKKLWTIVGVFVLVIIVLGLLSPYLAPKSQPNGYWGADGYYNPSDKEMEDVWDDVNKWMDKNW